MQIIINDIILEVKDKAKQATILALLFGDKSESKAVAETVKPKRKYKANRTYSFWSDADDNFLINNRPKMTVPQIAKILNKTIPAVANRYYKLLKNQSPTQATQDENRAEVFTYTPEVLQ